MAKVTKIQSAVTGDEYQVQNLDVQQSTGQSTEAVMSQKATTDALATKQGTIDDLQAIRSGAAAGATAYQKPSSGIPSSDMASGVQTSLGKADTAIQPGNIKQTTGESTGDVMSQKAVTDELEKKANKDGYYDTITAGMAENLVGQNADTATWEERPVGGEGAEVATGIASVQAAGGNGCVWNQLVPLDWKASATENNIQLINNGDGSYDVVVPDGGATQDTEFYKSIILPPSHLCYLRGNVDGGSNVYLHDGNAGFLEDTGNGSVGTISSNGILYLGIIVKSGTPAGTYHMMPQVTDLTIIDETLTTPTLIRAWLAAHIGTKPYYPYNAGTLLPAKLQGYKTTGKSANLLNPATRTARLFAYTWPDHNNMFTIKELPSGLTLTFTPDATGVAETITPDSNGHFSVSGSGNLVVSGSADLSATWLIATWDESMDDYDNFEAWDGKEYAFDTSKVYGKLNGAGDYVQVFPNGLRGAGAAKDVLDLTNAAAVVNIGSVDLGTLDLTYNSTYTFFISTYMLNKIKLHQTYDGSFDGICTKYIADTWANRANGQMTYGYYIGAGLYLFDYDKTDQDLVDGKAPWLDGVMLWYELAEPLNYTDLVYRDNGIDTPLSELNIIVNNWAYEQAVVSAPDNNGQPTSCAAQSTILYGIDAVEQLDTLKEAGIDIDAMRSNLDAMLTALQTAGVIGGYTLGVTPTNKVFSITITAPTPAE